MAIDRTAITLAIPLALVLACGSGHLVAQDETSTLGLRLTSKLKVAYGSDPLWAALVPEGEPMPDVKDLGQLPRHSGRFVDGRLNFKAIEAGRYQLRIYRVPTSGSPHAIRTSSEAGWRRSGMRCLGSSRSQDA